MDEANIIRFVNIMMRFYLCNQLIFCLLKYISENIINIIKGATYISSLRYAICKGASSPDAIDKLNVHNAGGQISNVFK